MSLSDGWVPVALSSSIEAGTSAGALVAGQEIVVWRDTGGTIHVWEDRCPHRGMRLSFGFVRGDHIACLYHGWQYDAGGQCRYIPAHPALDVPKTIKVPTYRSVEQSGIVFSTTREDAPSPVPDGSDTVPVRSLYIDRPLAAVEAALMEAGAESRSPLLAGLSIHGDDLLIGFQPVTGDRTALHIVLRTEPGTTVASRRIQSARWAEQMRWTIESGEASIAAVA